MLDFSKVVYEQPETGDRKEVTLLVYWYLFLFGVFYLFYKGLWKQGAIFMLCVLGASFIVRSVVILMIIILCLHTYLLLSIREFLDKHYRAQGYQKVEE